MKCYPEHPWIIGLFPFHTLQWTWSIPGLSGALFWPTVSTRLDWVPEPGTQWGGNHQTSSWYQCLQSPDSYHPIAQWYMDDHQSWSSWTFGALPDVQLYHAVSTGLCFEWLSDDASVFGSTWQQFSGSKVLTVSKASIIPHTPSNIPITCDNYQEALELARLSCIHWQKKWSQFHKTPHRLRWLSMCQGQWLFGFLQVNVGPPSDTARVQHQLKFAQLAFGGYPGYSWTPVRNIENSWNIRFLENNMENQHLLAFWRWTQGM